MREHRLEQEAQGLMLGRPLAENDIVFSYPGNKPLDPSTVEHAFSRVLREAGLPHIRFHDLRHTHATLLLKAGVHRKIVQERLGHSSIAVTIDTYSHVVPGLQELAAQRIEVVLGAEALKLLAGGDDVGTLAANGSNSVVKEGGV